MNYITPSLTRRLSISRKSLGLSSSFRYVSLLLILSVVVLCTCCSRTPGCSASFPPMILFFSDAALPLVSFLIYRSGPFRSRFPCLWYYDCVTTTHCPSRSLLAYTPGTVGLLLICVAFFSLFSPRAREKPRLFVSRLSLMRLTCLQRQ